MAIEKYLKENGIQSTGMAIEEYVTDPTAEPDTLQWLTKIYYPLTD
jgi:effector-binding domain-containing protein